jgi:methylthioribose-1-phosphate isomerase
MIVASRDAILLRRPTPCGHRAIRRLSPAAAAFTGCGGFHRLRRRLTSWRATRRRSRRTMAHDSGQEHLIDIDGTPYRTIWIADGDEAVSIIDQTCLPFRLEVARIDTVGRMAEAIATLRVRGAGCIGAAAGYGMYLAAREIVAAGTSPARLPAALATAGDRLTATRPTAVNLRWAVARQLGVLSDIVDPVALVATARLEADAIADEDAEASRRIGEHGLALLRDIHHRTRRTVNVLTHCNAGWLAFVDRGTATAPIYAAAEAGIPVHVWVDETRPVNQGARLTAWELRQAGVPHTVIVDNAGGHLMQHGLVDIVIVGSDRTTANGDVANKIGTYLKALAATDNGLPFYVALPSSSIDWTSRDGFSGTPIEQRSTREVTHVTGLVGSGDPVEVAIMPPDTPAANYAFDVTPARLVTGLITERGICPATAAGIGALFPERARAAESSAQGT